MLSEEKILLMKSLAVYEQKEEKKNIQISSYEKKDYVGMEMIKSFLCSTAAFLILFVLRILVFFEVWMVRLSNRSLRTTILLLLLEYVIFVVVYLLIARVLYTHRYKVAGRENQEHLANLKDAERLHMKSRSHGM